MTDKEKITNEETRKHIMKVQEMLSLVVKDLVDRGIVHDASKLEDPELSTFTRVTGRLAELTYGSEEYKACLKDMGPALEHHYENNKNHHPNHLENGVDDMTLMDIMEMLLDWKAATLHHDNGDILKSIKINKDRFNLSEQLASILENTIKYFHLEER